MASAPPLTSTTANTVSPMSTAPTLFTFDPSIANFNVPLGTYLKTSPTLDGLAVGAFVFDDAGRMLLVQRAAHDSMPLLWEIPGGAVDAEDESLLHSVARELWEETGLRARSMIELVGRGETFLTRHALRICKYAFIVDVEAYDVRLNPNEHQAFVWVTEDEAKAKQCGELDLAYTSKDQEDAILEAFSVKREKTDA
ncbi:NUDIX hydrolase domain-like protein [Xylariaceae sp. AK1471]|nr:NUDIX hydrolase domain-like protein [Xylariaceae sp. AK1471]